MLDFSIVCFSILSLIIIDLKEVVPRRLQTFVQHLKVPDIANTAGGDGAQRHVCPISALKTLSFGISITDLGQYGTSQALTYIEINPRKGWT